MIPYYLNREYCEGSKSKIIKSNYYRFYGCKKKHDYHKLYKKNNCYCNYLLTNYFFLNSDIAYISIKYVLLEFATFLINSNDVPNINCTF